MNKIGDTIGCHTTSFMDTGDRFCIKGKSYVITGIYDRNKFTIDSEYDKNHSFTFNDNFKKWFYLGGRILMIEKL